MLEQAIERQLLSSRSSSRLRFAAAVAAFGQQLRGGQYLGDFSYGKILELAQTAQTSDPFRAEFLNLVKSAQALSTPNKH